MNTYNISGKDEDSTILYHAIARSEVEVRALMLLNNIKTDNMEIELERENVRTQLGREPQACIKDALVY